VVICVVTRESRALLAKWKAVADALLFPCAAPRPATPSPRAQGATRPKAPLLDHANRTAIAAPPSTAATK
jgi:hypothetical protein